MLRNRAAKTPRNTATKMGTKLTADIDGLLKTVYTLRGLVNDTITPFDLPHRSNTTRPPTIVIVG